MNLFKKQKKSWSLSSIRIRQRFERGKIILCTYLNRAANGCSKKTIRLYWIFFILLGTGISLQICTQAILNHSFPVFDSVQVRIIRLPILKMPAQVNGNQKLISTLENYRYLLDSLAKYDPLQYCKLTLKCPLLRDSLSKLIIQLSQNIK